MSNFELPASLTDWLPEYQLLGNSAGRWFTAIALFFVASIILRLAKGTLAKRAASLTQRTSSGWDDAFVEALERTKWWFLIALAAYLASLSLNLPTDTQAIVQTAAILILLLQTAFWGNVVITGGVRRYIDQRLQDDPASAMTVSALALLGKVVLFSLLLLLALDNLGIDVTALIAGLGVGGIAVALAVQNILGDLLASLSIVFDKPFVIGDFIIVGDEMGTVEKIGLKTTRVRSLTGEQLVFPNNDLLQSRIRNYKRMQQRRVVFGVGVTYDTPREKLEQIPQILREAVEAQEQVRFDRAHLKEFGDFSLNYEIVYHVLTADYNAYMDIQQAMNLVIYERFAELDVEFAFPTQTLFLEKSGSQS